MTVTIIARHQVEGTPRCVPFSNATPTQVAKSSSFTSLAVLRTIPRFCISASNLWTAWCVPPSPASLKIMTSSVAAAKASSKEIGVTFSHDNIRPSSKSAALHTSNKNSWAMYELHANPMGHVRLTGHKLEVSKTSPGNKQACTSSAVMPPMEHNSCWLTLGLPIQRRKLAGNASWSNQQLASRLLHRIFRPCLHSRKVNAVGEARCRGFGGRSAAADTLRPCHTTLCRLPPGFPTAMTVPPPQGLAVRPSCLVRSCLTTSLMYSSRSGYATSSHMSRPFGASGNKIWSELTSCCTARDKHDMGSQVPASGKTSTFSAQSPPYLGPSGRWGSGTQSGVKLSQLPAVGACSLLWKSTQRLTNRCKTSFCQFSTKATQQI